MAKAKKLPSGSWRAQVYDRSEPVFDSAGSPVIDPKTGKQKQKRIYVSFTAETRKEAEYMAAEHALNKKDKGRISNITFGAALDEYIENRSSVLSPSTIREYKRCRAHDAQELMSVRICDITQETVQEIINKEAITHAPKTVRNIHGLISAVMGIYRPNFSLKTQLPKKVRPALYIPTDEQVNALIRAVEGTEMELPVLLAAFGPMRRSEICALDSAHIAGNIVHVEYAMVLDDNKQWVIKPPKSYAGNRYIEFPDFVAKKLKGKEGRIVSLNPAMVSDRFIDVLRKSGIPHFRFHDLRHYCASIQHAIGIPDVYIMQRGGWGSDAVLKSVYRHALDDKIVQMNQKTNEHFNKVCNTKCNTKK